MALKNPKIKYDVVRGTERFSRRGEVSGYVTDRNKLMDLLAHPWGPDAKIENLRQVDDAGKDLPEQPAELQPAQPAPKLPEEPKVEEAPAAPQSVNP
jgi:hypothetical protein